jgi:hypothetical protein
VKLTHDLLISFNVYFKIMKVYTLVNGIFLIIVILIGDSEKFQDERVSIKVELFSLKIEDLELDHDNLISREECRTFIFDL